MIHLKWFEKKKQLRKASELRVLDGRGHFILYKFPKQEDFFNKI